MDFTTLQGQKYLWKLPVVDKKQVLSIASRYNLSNPIAHVLVTRGYADDDKIQRFLFSSFEKDVGHPAQLKDAQKAVERILKAIDAKEKILVFGDYDVDGITSSSLMMLCLLPLGAQINFFLPHRVKDGYGLSTKVVKRAAKNGYSLLITVDNGIAAFKAAQKAQELGVDLIITDHHREQEKLPVAYAIVNPNQKDCDYPCKALAGVGVTFKLLSLLYEKKKLSLPVKVYELLLLGTIADVVPLLDENRYWVRHGLHCLNSINSYSVQVLKQNAKITKPKISATDIGFTITPQINALGRLEDPRDGVKFLIGSNKKEIEHIGTVLFELNQARKEIEKSIINDVQEQIKQGHIDIDKEHIIIAASNSWPPGVIGLVASRFVGMYGKPTLLFHLTKDGKAKGSGRSIPEFNLFDALHASKNLLLQFGGHSHAAGLSLLQTNLAQLKQNLEQAIAQQLTEDDLKQKLELDSRLTLHDLNKRFMSDMEHLEPFGHKNRQPFFYLEQVVLIKPPTLLKDEHVKCTLFADGIIKHCIFFNRPELFDLLLAQGSEPFDVAAQVSENYWNGKANLELIGQDVRFSVKEGA